MKSIVILILLLPSVSFSFCEGNPPKDICNSEFKNYELVNQYRVSKGAKELNLSVYLSYVARDWSKKMAEDGRISHSGFPKARSKVLFENFAFLIGAKVNRENVASYSGLSGEPGERFHKMWVTSPGHAANMRAKDVVAIGVGIYKSGNGYYATQLFGSDGVFFAD